MIDFLSTRPGIKPEEAACSRLFAAIIARAVLDAVQPPNAIERKGRATRETMDRHALDALEFLFGRPSLFPYYAGLMGADERNIRRALVAGNFATGGRYSFFAENNARLLRSRLYWSRINYEEGLK